MSATKKVLIVASVAFVAVMIYGLTKLRSVNETT